MDKQTRDRQLRGGGPLWVARDAEGDVLGAISRDELSEALRDPKVRQKLAAARRMMARNKDPR